MPRKDIESRRAYNREYARTHPRILTAEQVQQRSAYAKEWYRQASEQVKARVPIASDTQKQCSRCGEVKSVSEFYTYHVSPDGYQPHCKVCDSARKKAQYYRDHAATRAHCTELSRQWRAANPERHKASNIRSMLKRNYGITVEDYGRLFAKQNGVCALCGRPGNRAIGPGALEVDHCHSTGAVRGLLCRACNMGIGMLGDTQEAFLRAAEYVSQKPHRLGH